MIVDYQKAMEMLRFPVGVVSDRRFTLDADDGQVQPDIYVYALDGTSVMTIHSDSSYTVKFTGRCSTDYLIAYEAIIGEMPETSALGKWTVHVQNYCMWTTFEMYNRMTITRDRNLVRDGVYEAAISKRRERPILAMKGSVKGEARLVMIVCGEDDERIAGHAIKAPPLIDIWDVNYGDINDEREPPGPDHDDGGNMPF